MENELLTVFFLVQRRNRARRRLLRPRIHRSLECINSLFDMSDHSFVRTYRLTKDMVNFLVGELCPVLLPMKKITDLPPEIRILIALRFFAQGSYQLSVGRDLQLQVSQKSVSNCIRQVSEAIVTQLSGTMVRFPSPEEMPAVKAKFYEKHQFPGVIGAIDCTHIAIKRPNVNEHVYVNRKGYHSLNVQLICDADYKITNVNARYPGSTHDSFIWRMSAINTKLNNLWSTGELQTSWLIGDSGYPLCPYLLTPYAAETQVPLEMRYNTNFVKARATIEQVNGQLKNRFRCLLKHRVLHYSPMRAAKTTLACIVLHNLCKEARLDDVETETEENIDAAVAGIPAASGNLLTEGRRVRDSVARMLAR